MTLNEPPINKHYSWLVLLLIEFSSKMKNDINLSCILNSPWRTSRCVDHSLLCLHQSRGTSMVSLLGIEIHRIHIRWNTWKMKQPLPAMDALSGRSGTHFSVKRWKLCFREVIVSLRMRRVLHTLMKLRFLTMSWDFTSSTWSSLLCNLLPDDSLRIPQSRIRFTPLT